MILCQIVENEIFCLGGSMLTVIDHIYDNEEVEGSSLGIFLEIIFHLILVPAATLLNVTWILQFWSASFKSGE